MRNEKNVNMGRPEEDEPIGSPRIDGHPAAIIASSPFQPINAGQRRHRDDRRRRKRRRRRRRRRR